MTLIAASLKSAILYKPLHKPGFKQTVVLCHAGRTVDFEQHLVLTPKVSVSSSHNQYELV